jgi:hypothetical protein
VASAGTRTAGNGTAGNGTAGNGSKVARSNGATKRAEPLVAGKGT